MTVNNVAPTVILSAGERPVDEGTTHTYSYTVTDPGTDAFTVDAATRPAALNGTSSDTFDTTAAGGSFHCTFPTARPRPTSGQGHRLRRRVRHRLREASSSTVTNVAPIVTRAADRRSNEGDATPTARHPTDPGEDTLDGLGRLGRRLADGHFTHAAGTLGSFVCTYPDGPASHGRGHRHGRRRRHRHGHAHGHVDNVAPTIALSGAARVNEGQPTA